MSDVKDKRLKLHASNSDLSRNLASSLRLQRRVQIIFIAKRDVLIATQTTRLFYPNGIMAVSPVFRFQI